MLKVVTIMTDKYRKVLRRGQQDKVKLLFRSLAVFDRRASMVGPQEKIAPALSDQTPVGDVADLGLPTAGSHVAGFSIDEPANQDEEEDDDNLVLAALDSLDAIEVFKYDQKVDRKINHAHIPIGNLKKLVMLMLVLSRLDSQDNLAESYGSMSQQRLTTLHESADAILRAFDPDPIHKGIRYRQFVEAFPIRLPFIFAPMSPLFEHFLFSKNIDLSRHRGSTTQTAATSIERTSIIHLSPEVNDTIFNDTILAHINTFLQPGQGSESQVSHPGQSHVSFHRLYSTNAHGTSISSFSRQVSSWSSPTILLLTGNALASSQTILLGAYLPNKWQNASNQATQSEGHGAVMFQLRPRHAVFPANPYNKSIPISHLSPKTGISLGCIIPGQSRTNTAPQPPIPGPVSLVIDSDISTATFQHDGNVGSGAFLTDTGLENAQRSGSPDVSQPKKVEIDLEALEVWGISIADESGEDALAQQKKRLDWEEAEAARRRGVNFGGDKDGARALLEMAGIIGEDAQNRSGGSV